MVQTAVTTTTSSTTRTAYRICPLCEAGCGLELTMERQPNGPNGPDGLGGNGGPGTATETVKRIRGDRDDVFSHGFICPKGSTLKQLHEDPDWLRQPLVRRDGELVPATWDEAFAEVERRLLPVIERYGRDAVAVYLGNPNVHSLGAPIFGRALIKALGTTKVFSASTVDQRPKEVTCGLMFGHPLTVPVPDVDRTDHLLMLGANPYASNGSLATAPDWPGRIEALLARGGRLVVVDPRRTRTAEVASEHVAIKPGADPFMLMAMVNVLVDEGLVDPDLGGLAAYVEGLDDVLALAVPFTPEAVAPVTGVDAETIRRLARELAAAPTACVYGRMGTTTVEFGSLTSWLVDVLNLLTGNLDRPGGAMFTKAAAGAANTRGRPRYGRGVKLHRRRSRVRGLPETYGELPVACLAEEIDVPGEGQIRALVTVAGNPAVSTPDAGRLDAALATLDCFVAVDPYVNETTRHADVILPVPSALQKGHYDLALLQLAVRNVAHYSPPVLPLDEGQLDEWEVLARMALVAQGMGASADPALVDDLAVRSLVRSAVADEHGPIAGRDADEIVAALGDRRGPERVLDLMLRLGPYGDGFGAREGEAAAGAGATVGAENREAAGGDGEAAGSDGGNGEVAGSRGLSLDVLLEHPHGVDLGPLQPRLPEALRTPSGMIELAPELLVTDVGRLQAALDDRRKVTGNGHGTNGHGTNGSLVLIGRRDLRSNNSWMHNVEVLVKGRPRCTLLVHPADAQRLGLVDGQGAEVSSRTGKLTVPVEVTDTIRPGVVSIPHGWGHDVPGVELSVARRYAGVNSNLLADGTLVDAVSGNAVLNGIPVTVTPA